ncbi:dihydrodipicolinate synthase family protein [Chelatococcus asaccharovorans]|uniref:4-hydroxy-tetrahydrodipicolinate synthase n=1 Tax=Chelatococcus asaccharovorans TaxID=28210 RepID=A0A2V3UL72_9HYPH|nr:dihydrodipicolinate synthase family protein [Chelatococcus asaccharovorans]MBS7706287.1 dihydrodipicolinate synthase family protein [Chelatococcus asaccharovorans]PXW65074.1 4-hydroxy-tetrahydrodipicolinate synthase [Chelatococcus asaccharovorans]
MVKWSGVFPALTTKLSRDGQIDLKATQAGVQRALDGGVSGIVVLGMLGENGMMTTTEKESILRAAKEVVGSCVPLLSGLAEATTQDAVAYAKLCERVGLDGLMVFPAITYKTDHRETVAYYQAIGDAAPSLGLMVYNNPVAYRVDVTPELLEKLGEVKNVVCIKEESYDIRRITDIYKRCGDRFLVFCGIDDFVLESVAAGATGWVSGMTNAWPAECVELFNLCSAGRFEEARALYRLMIEAFHLDTDVKLVHSIKLADHLTSGAPEHLRAPRLPLVGDERARAEQIIKQVIRDLENRRNVCDPETMPARLPA